MSTGSVTLYFDEHGNQVWPCRCGEVHSGPYGAHDYAHHDCLHDAPLCPVDSELDPGHLICSACGKDFWVER